MPLTAAWQAELLQVKLSLALRCEWWGILTAAFCTSGLYKSRASKPMAMPSFFRHSTCFWWNLILHTSQLPLPCFRTYIASHSKDHNTVSFPIFSFSYHCTSKQHTLPPPSSSSWMHGAYNRSGNWQKYLTFIMLHMFTYYSASNEHSAFYRGTKEKDRTPSQRCVFIPFKPSHFQCNRDV